MKRVIISAKTRIAARSGGVRSIDHQQENQKRVTNARTVANRRSIRWHPSVTCRYGGAASAPLHNLNYPLNFTLSASPATTSRANSGRWSAQDCIQTLSVRTRSDNIMQDSTNLLLCQVISLPPNERASLVEGIIASLDRPDPSLDALWLKEAEERLAAYDAGELEATDADQVFSELGRST